MTYSIIDFPTKASLKRYCAAIGEHAAVTSDQIEYDQIIAGAIESLPDQDADIAGAIYLADQLSVLDYQQPGPFGDGIHPITDLSDGESIVIEGPHYPRPHTFYAKITRRGDRLVVA